MSFSYRRLDAFVKPRHDLRTRSVLGGLITIVATVSALILFVLETYTYWRGITLHSLHLTESVSIPLLPFTDGNENKVDNNYYYYRNDEEYHDDVNMIPLKLHVTFPHVPCNQLDFTLNDASYRSGTLKKTHRGRHFLTLRSPTTSEFSQATGMSSHGGASSAAARARREASVDGGTGCTVIGDLLIPMVGGEFALAITRRKWIEATGNMLLEQMMDIEDSLHRPKLNTSHYIHRIRFGNDPYPFTGMTTSATTSSASTSSPLENKNFIVENKFGGIALQRIQVTLIPTIYREYFNFMEHNTFQLSIVEHTVLPETLIDKGVPLLPGVSLSYDFSPIAVHQIEVRDNIVVFFGSLVSIVGGVFVTVSLIVSCFLHSAASVVAKKLD